MLMLYFKWSYCKQLASNVKLGTGKYKIISRQLGSYYLVAQLKFQSPWASGLISVPEKQS
jgi:hypothetical protein